MSRTGNLPHQTISERDGRYFANDQPLVFFHFSGFDPCDPDTISVHDRRYRARGVPDIVRKLFREYTTELRQNGMDSYGDMPYYFDFFAGSTIRIAPIVRRMYRQEESIQRLFGEDPFDLSRDPGFARSYNKPAAGPNRVLTHLSLELWRTEETLRRMFPDANERDALSYAQRFVKHAGTTFGLDEPFVAPVRSRLCQVLGPAGSGQDDAPAPPQEVRWLVPILRRLVNPPAALFAALIAGTPHINEFLGDADAVHRTMRRFAQAVRNIIRGIWRYCIDVPTKRIFAAAISQAALSYLQRSGWKTTPCTNSSLPETGLRIIGWVHAESGLGESMRSTLRALSAADIPVQLINFTGHCGSRMQEEVPRQIRSSQPGDPLVSLIHVNIDTFASLFASMASEALTGMYRIGYWVWETSRVPDEWEPLFDTIDEIWTPSSFCQDLFAQKAGVPVVKIPHNVNVDVPEQMDRNVLRLPENRFLFLCAADFLSTPERKNPLGAIEAFVKAFGPNPEHTALVVKLSNSHLKPDVMRDIQRCCDSNSGIIVLDGYLTRPMVNGLLNACDCYVSLHRSEGFGLPIAEAMYLGKPAIGTGWSGNMEFMTPHNSLLVRHTMTELQDNVPPYHKGEIWAEPDLDHAAEHMQRIVSDESLREGIGQQARQDMREHFSPQRIGRLIRDRLTVIGRVMRARG